MATADEKTAETIGRALDGRIGRLNEERLTLLPSSASLRVQEIDAELAVLNTEKARIDPRRPPRPPGVVVPGDAPPTREIPVTPAIPAIPPTRANKP